MARTEAKWKKGVDFISPSDDVPVLLRNTYLNFGGSLVGEDGYGFRDNAGVMQVKNSGGSWANFGGGSGSGTVDTVVAGTGIDVDATDPANPVVALDTLTQASLDLADSAQQPPSEGAFVDGDKTKLDGIEASADVTDTTNVTAAGALMDSEVTNLAQVKAFDTTDYATAAQGATADTAQQPPAEGAFANGDKTKLDHISVTQAVDLDQMESDIAALDAAIVLQGTWDASAGTFPGSGTAQAGASWIVSTGGTVDGEVFTANDRIVAITDNASTTVYAANWHKLDYTDAVLSVAGKTGAVTLDASDISETAGLKILTSAERTVIGNQSGTNSGDEAAASTTVAGVVELATDAEFTTGTDATRYVTADQVQGVTQTMENKRITQRRGSTTSSATPTINTDNYDIYSLTAQAVDITSFTTNLSGTPTHGQKLLIEITGTAARAITWGASFEASTIDLPTTTVTTAMLSVGFIYNSDTSKWRCVGSV